MFNLLILYQLGTFSIHNIDIDADTFFRFPLLGHLLQILYQ